MSHFRRCPECGRIFPKWRAVIEYTSYEAYFGAPTPGHHPLTVEHCPECGCDSLEEYQPETEEEADDLEAL